MQIYKFAASINSFPLATFVAGIRPWRLAAQWTCCGYGMDAFHIYQWQQGEVVYDCTL